MTRPTRTRGLVYTTSTFSESTIAGKATCFIPKSKNRSNQQDRDELRLGWACRWGRVELVKLFLERGADAVEAGAEPWATPRAWAEKMGHAAVLQVLRDHWAT